MRNVLLLQWMTPVNSAPLSRRAFLLAATSSAALSVFPALAAADDPAAPIRAIYQRVAAGKGDKGGQFVWAYARSRQRLMSASLVRLWAAAEAKVAPGDMGPPGFDPVTNSQDPLVHGFAVTVEQRSPRRATVAVTFGRLPGDMQRRRTQVVRYDMVRERGAWLIDDIRGSVEGDPWSIRAILRGFKG